MKEFHKSGIIRSLTLPLALILLFSLLISCSEKNIRIENSNFSYVIDKSGNNLHFIDKASGRDYLDTVRKSKCASIVKEGRHYDVTSVRKRGRTLELSFSDADVNATVKLMKGKKRIYFTVSGITGDVDSFTFLNIPLTLEGMPYEPFSACALSMNLFTRVRELPALQSNLWATSYKKFGIEKAEAAIIGVPQKEMLHVIRNVMSGAKNVPFSDKGGAWAQQNKEGYGSYLMNFGTLTEESVDEWVQMCKNLGFNQIDNHGGGDFFRFGDFELNTKKWPGGWNDFKKINDRLHSAGISVIFHTYAFFIDKNCRYVTPVPSEDLGYFSSFTLAQNINASDSVITVNESTENISTITGFFVRNSKTLRIGKELIEFNDVTRKPPFRFTGCKRGVNNTAASDYSAGEKAFHLREMFGRFVPDPDSKLFTEIAGHTAEIVNDCGFDGIYFDAIDGSDILGGEEYFWYYGTKFIFEVASQLKKPVGMEMSSMAHHWWHYRSRWQAWDRPVRGYKEFIDIHSAAVKTGRLFYPPVIKSNENEHGLWRGHQPLIRKYASAENGGLLLPLHFGWWGNQTWNPPQVEPTFSDDIDYLCCKMLGNNAGMSMLGGADEKTLNENPAFRRITEQIRQYEELRHSGYFCDSVRTLLREAGKEFTLFRDNNDKWNLKPVSYKKQKVSVSGNQASTWKSINDFRSQPVKVRIEPLMNIKRYNDPEGKTLTAYRSDNEFAFSGSAKNLQASVNKTDEKSPDGMLCVKFQADTKGIPSQEGLWVKMEKRFEPGLDLGINQGLGVWVKGDGSGQLLNIRLESPKHLSHGARGDHFIKVNFTGWKYFELVEIESSEFSNYIWPDSGFYVYDSYRHTVLFNNIDKLQLWYNNLPGEKKTACVIGPIKALPIVKQTIENPSVMIGDKKIIFRCKMESGMYLEFFSRDNCKLYGPKGELIADVVTEGDIPELGEGENEISFNCKGSSKENSRVQVTVISEGEPVL
jgi:hypothetical protein